MRRFDEIYDIAASRKGGAEALETLLGKPLPASELAQITDDRWLSAMAKCVFQAGFSWKVIAAKWDGFEEAFEGFNPGRVSHYADEALDRLMSDKGIVRNGPKIVATLENAVFLANLARDHGTASQFFADWDDRDFVGLLAFLKKEGSRLGGNTGQRLLRTMGKDSFVLSQDVTARLIAEGVVEKQPSSKRDMTATQAAFNTWRDQSGRSLTEISRTLAFSVGV